MEPKHRELVVGERRPRESWRRLQLGKLVRKGLGVQARARAVLAELKASLKVGV